MAVELSIRGISSTSNRTTWTWSGWVKRTNINSTGFLFSGNNERTGGGNYTSISFSSERLRFYNYYSGSAQDDLQTNALYRDTNGWYHIVVAYDSTQATESNRVKLYVNGEQITSFNTANYPGQNDGAFVNVSGNDHYIGTQTNSLNEAFDGCMTHIHFTDGTAYAASDFGETDSTTGIWKPKTDPSVTYGTNGFFLNFENTSDYGEDSSGQNNDFTVQQGTITQTIDTPSNVFAVLNAVNKGSNVTLSKGGTRYSTNDSWECAMSTLAFSKGKYYAEFEISSSTSGGASELMIGIEPPGGENSFLNTYPGQTAEGVGYISTNGKRYKNDTAATYGDSFDNGDIIGVAVDMDNGYVYFSKNGTWQNSGDPTSGSSGTGGISIGGSEYYFVGSGRRSTTDAKFEVNFGNGYFGQTAISSAGTNAGIGTFEYDVPSGYKALCTKNINAEEYS